MLPSPSVRRRYLVAVSCVLALAQVTAAQQPDAAPESKGPLSVGILLDGSTVACCGSGTVRAAMRAFLQSLRPPDEYALFTASDRFHVEQDFTKDASLADDGLRRLRSNQDAPLNDAIISALQHVAAHGKNARKALLVMSAGEDKGSQASLNDTVLAAQRTGVAVFAITVPGEGARSWNLEQLAALSNGAAYLPLQQSELAGVVQVAAREVIGPPLPAVKSPPPRKPLAGYSVLAVRGIPVSASEDISNFAPGDNVVLQKLLLAALQEQQMFSTVTDAGDQPASAPGAAKGVAPRSKLELAGTIVEYRRGSQFKRSTAGWLGSGVARLKVAFTLRDAATGETVLSLDESGSGSSGFLGTSNNDDNQNQAMRKLISNLLKDLKRNR